MAQPETTTTSRPLVVESRSARREFTQCQNCFKDKDQFKIKLSLCTGCRVATYCSSACQKAHWPVHKTMCLIRREQEKRCEDLDEKSRRMNESSLILESTSVPPLPTEIVTELRAFTRKFNPALFQAGFNCLHLATHPTTYKDLVVWVNLERIPNPSPNSRTWSRFKVNFVGPLPVQHLLQKFKNPNFLEVKAEQERHHKAAGNIGTITIVLSAACPGIETVMNNVTYIGFGTHSAAALDLSDDWQEQFAETVEKLCGRSSS